MANNNDTTPERVEIKAKVPIDLDQQLEIEVAKQRSTKSQMIEDAVRAHLKTFHAKRGAA